MIVPALLLALLAPAQDPYRKWIDEEVFYTASARERREFLKLDDDPQRDEFIRGFWLRRDPDPSTAINEFQEEHYRRLRHVKEAFNREGKPGWKTSRGRSYIIHGPPDNISYSFGGQQKVIVRNPTDVLNQTGTAQPFIDVEFPAPESETWVYRSFATTTGYRPNFTIIFAKMDTIELYALQNVVAQVGDSTSLLSRYRRDNAIKAFIRNRSYLRNDFRIIYAGGPQFLTLSDLLVTIFDPTRTRQVDQFEILQAQADAHRPSGERLEMLAARRKELEEMVSGRVFYGSLPVEVGIAFLRGEGRQVRIPIHLRSRAEDSPPTEELDILAELVSTEDNRIIAFLQDRVQAPTHQRPRGEISYQSRLGAPPGDYRLRVVVSDVENKRIGIWDRELKVPDLSGDTFGASELVLCEKVEGIGDYRRQAEASTRKGWLHQNRQRPLRLDDWVFIPSADRRFRRMDNLTTLLEVYNPTLYSGKPQVQVQALCSFGDTVVAATDVKDLGYLTGDTQSIIVYAFSVPLRTLDPGAYDLVVRIVDTPTGEALVRRIPFSIH